MYDGVAVCTDYCRVVLVGLDEKDVRTSTLNHYGLAPDGYVVDGGSFRL